VRQSRALWGGRVLSYLTLLSQIVTYLVCGGLEYRFKVLIDRVRQATKDVVKSEV